MNITRTSFITGKTHTRNLPVTTEQFDRYESGELVHTVFTNLEHEQIEFIKNGATQEEWDYIFEE
jgi:hypothetical protein